MRASDHQYSKMNVDDDDRYGSRRSGSYDDDMEEAQRKLEELRSQKEELDAYKRRTEEIDRKKAEFIEDQNVVGERLFLATDKIEAELESMRSEMAELEQIRACFKKDLGLLGGIHADSWPQEAVEQHLSRALDVLEACNEDYNDAVDHCLQMKHSKVLTRAKRKKTGMWIGLKDGWLQFQQGLAFHLPLVVLLVIVFLVYSCQRQTPVL